MSSHPEAVLIGGFGQLRPLAAAGLFPLVVRRSPRDILRYSRHFRDSGLVMPDGERDEQPFVDALLRLSATLPERPVLYYGDDRLLRFVARNQQRLREGYRFEMPDRELVEACLDKTRFCALGERVGLALPRQLVATPELDAAQIERTIGFPCALKPDSHDGWFDSEAVRERGRGPQKILRADDRAECEAALAAIRRFSDRFIVQEFIPGGEDRIYSFHAYVSRRPRPRAAYVGRKIRTLPSLAGESTMVRLVANDEVMRLGWETTERLGLTGLIKIDFKHDVARDRYYVLEVNLRSTLWNQLGARCGINLPELAYRDLCDQPCETGSEYRTDVRWLHLTRDLRTFFGDYYPSGQLTLGRWLRSYAGPTTYAVFAWDDPLPCLAHWATTLRKAGRRVLQRVRSRPAPGRHAA
jgi:predicted ATP-grasp superfamily ATP-dependent carboligase